jgi:hypothetical protein
MRKSLVCLIAGLLLASGSVVHAGGEGERESLRGIQAVGVKVEQLDPKTGQAAPLQDLLQTRVEQQLRKARIRVADINWDSPEEPYLFATVGWFEVRKGSEIVNYVYNGWIALIQQVVLKRNNQSSVGATWIYHFEDKCRAADKGDIEKAVLGAVDEFINDFLAVNPR